MKKVSNRQQVPDEIAMICERINNDRNGNEIRIAADEYASSYIRVYDPALNMAYGRRGAGAVDKNAKKALSADQCAGSRWKKNFQNLRI